MSEQEGIPAVPKRKRPVEALAGRSEIVMDATEPPPLVVDEDPVSRVQGCLLGRTHGGWVLVDVAIPEDVLARYATKVRPPEIYEIVRGTLEQRFDRIAEETSSQALRGKARSGVRTPVSCASELRDAVAELRARYWGDAVSEDEADVALERFAATGQLDPAPIVEGVRARGDDRARLQAMMSVTGGWVR
jgi:hypothetical protein